MEITEVRIKLMEDNSGSNERLQAFCSITFDDMFVIRDLKIIEGAKGFFVAMPSRKLTDRCHNCGTKNHLRSRFCNQCGCRLDENRALRDADGRAKLHADIAHPINSMCREKIQAAVLSSYAEELERSKMPGYVSRYDEYEADDFELQYEGHGAAPPMSSSERAAPAPRSAPRPHPACPRQPVCPARPAHLQLARRARAEGHRLRPPSSRRVVVVRQRPLRLPAGPGQSSWLPIPNPERINIRSHPSRGIRLIDQAADPAGSGSFPRPRRVSCASSCRVVVVAYLGFLAVLTAFQARMIFPGASTQGQPYAELRPRAGTELVKLTSSSGERVVALLGPALTPDGRPDLNAAARPTMIYFYGNAMCVNDATDEFDDFAGWV